MADDGELDMVRELAIEVAHSVGEDGKVLHHFALTRDGDNTSMLLSVGKVDGKALPAPSLRAHGADGDHMLSVHGASVLLSAEQALALTISAMHGLRVMEGLMTPDQAATMRVFLSAFVGPEVEASAIAREALEDAAVAARDTKSMRPVPPAAD